MNDLVTWLRAQIADAERTARDDQWGRPHGPGCGITADVCPGCDCTYWRDVLAQCEAHTALLDSYAEHIAMPEYTPYVKGRRDKALHDLRLLALAYQHRPGYREEWRP